MYYAVQAGSVQKLRTLLLLPTDGHGDGQGGGQGPAPTSYADWVRRGTAPNAPKESPKWGGFGPFSLTNYS